MTTTTQILKFIGTVMAFTAYAAAVNTAQAQTSVSISVNQPGVYGRVVIGERPPPVAWVMPQPVLILPPPVVIAREPIYLYVPPGHYQNWSRHCGRYNACGQPVVFVQERWVRDRYAEAHPYGDGYREGHGNGNGKGKYKDKYQDNDDDKHHGKGHGKGNGKGDRD